ncbi:MAG: flagellar hook-basal body protein, partial [Armatimonadetes bacterium]|nr:flagellar hook-basal body protein [Armatimonadota bacterium]
SPKAVRSLSYYQNNSYKTSWIVKLARTHTWWKTPIAAKYRFDYDEDAKGEQAACRYVHWRQPMIRAFYAAASGMVAQSSKQDIIANNIANAQTAGFKRQRVAATSFAETLERSFVSLKDASRPPYPDSPVNPVMVTVQDAVDTSPGAVRVTGNDLDLAIEGPGAFEVVLSGTTRQTRNGAFRIDSSGELCTLDGAKVQGKSGNIKLPQGKIAVAQDGTITANGVEVDKIKIVGENPDETKITQGALEESNVNVIREMTDMIVNMRSFEANQRVIGNVDRTLEKLINEAGKV